MTVDNRLEGCERTRRLLPPVVALGDAARLPFRTASFSVVTLWDVLEHLVEPSLTIAEVRRVLQTNGLLAMSTPNTQARSVRLKGQRSTQFRDPTHVSLLAPTEWLAMLEAEGFVPVLFGTDAHWDFPYPGDRLPIAARRLITQSRFLARFTYEGLLDGENVCGLFRSVES